MGLFKPASDAKDAEKSNMTLLKGLAIVGLIGILAYVVLQQFIN
ncbi:hypothetical protein [Mesopusillimonas faecipullorum]|nr:hypothetical protein [Mesopusillimonas faecipullorum]